MSEDGYRAPIAQQAAGISYRQIDYWARTGLVKPTIEAKGSGTQRLYSAQDVALLVIVKRLLDVGFSMAAIRGLVDVQDANQMLGQMGEDEQRGTLAAVAGGKE